MDPEASVVTPSSFRGLPEVLVLFKTNFSRRGTWTRWRHPAKVASEAFALTTKTPLGTAREFLHSG